MKRRIEWGPIAVLAAAVAIGIFFLLVGFATAQQPSAPPASPMEQALTGKLNEEYGQNIQLRASLVQLQQQLAAEQAKVKALEDAAKVKVGQQETKP